MKSTFFTYVLVREGLSTDHVGVEKLHRISGDTAVGWFQNRRFRKKERKVGGGGATYRRMSQKPQQQGGAPLPYVAHVRRLTHALRWRCTFFWRKCFLNGGAS